MKRTTTGIAIALALAVAGGRIESIRTLSGKVFKAKMFIDATYEGDLMAAAGVAVQDVDYRALRDRLERDGQVLSAPRP